MIKSFISLLTIAVLMLSCSVKKEKPEAEPQNALKQNTESLSELRVLMYTMESKMQLLKKDIKEQKSIDSSYFNDYQRMFSVPASAHVKRDSIFTHFGSDFLDQFNTLTKNNHPDSINDQYNTVINSCVTCHKTYCPGPVTRIQKLLL